MVSVQLRCTNIFLRHNCLHEFFLDKLPLQDFFFFGKITPSPVISNGPSFTIFSGFDKQCCCHGNHQYGVSIKNKISKPFQLLFFPLSD